MGPACEKENIFTFSQSIWLSNWVCFVLEEERTLRGEYYACVLTRVCLFFSNLISGKTIIEACCVFVALP